MFIYTYRTRNFCSESSCKFCRVILEKLLRILIYKFLLPILSAFTYGWSPRDMPLHLRLLLPSARLARTSSAGTFDTRKFQPLISTFLYLSSYLVCKTIHNELPSLETKAESLKFDFTWKHPHPGLVERTTTRNRTVPLWTAAKDLLVCWWLPVLKITIRFMMGPRTLKYIGIFSCVKSEWLPVTFGDAWGYVANGKHLMTAKVVEALVRNQCSLPAADDGGRSGPNDAWC